MSVMMLTAKHIAILAANAHGTRPFELSLINITAQTLWLANRDAYIARYKEAPEGAGPVLTPQDVRDLRCVRAVRVLKLAQCFEYQCGNWKGWETSQARTHYENVVTGTITRLPDYNDAPWSI